MITDLPAGEFAFLVFVIVAFVGFGLSLGVMSSGSGKK